MATAGWREGSAGGRTASRAGAGRQSPARSRRSTTTNEAMPTAASTPSTVRTVNAMLAMAAAAVLTAPLTSTAATRTTGILALLDALVLHILTTWERMLAVHFQPKPAPPVCQERIGGLPG